MRDGSSLLQELARGKSIDEDLSQSKLLAIATFVDGGRKWGEFHRSASRHHITISRCVQKDPLQHKAVIAQRAQLVELGGLFR